MFGYRELCAKALALARGLVEYALQDPYVPAQQLLRSAEERDRIAGLRNLGRSSDPRAERAALAGYRFASSPSERLAGESTLVSLSAYSRDFAREAVTVVAQRWQKPDCVFWSPEHLERSRECLDRLYHIAQLGPDERRELDTMLLSWWTRVSAGTSRDVRTLLEQMVQPGYNDDRLEFSSQLFPVELRRACDELNLIHVLRAFDSEGAQTIRGQMLLRLELSNFALFVVDSFVPFIDQPLVLDAMCELKQRWLDEHGPEGVHADFFASLSIPAPRRNSLRVIWPE